jgi:hypothetical protein
MIFYAGNYQKKGKKVIFCLSHPVLIYLQGFISDPVLGWLQC